MMRFLSRLNFMIFSIFLSISCTKKFELPKTDPHQKNGETSKKEVPVSENTDKNQEVISSQRVMANVIAKDQTQLLFRTQGMIHHIFVQPGDKVREGQELANLDDTQQRLALRAALIDIDTEKYTLELEAHKLNRLETQFKNGLVSATAVGEQKSNVGLQETIFDKAKNALEQKKYELSHTKLRAPYAGIISERFKSVGDVVSSNDPIFQITSAAPLEFRAQIPLAYFDKILLKSTLFFEGASSLTTGQVRVDRLVPVADAKSRTFDIYGSILTTSRPLFPGDFIQIQLW